MNGCIQWGFTVNLLNKLFEICYIFTSCFRGTEVKSDCCDKFLMILCHVLQRRDQATTDWPVESDLSDVKCM